MFTFFQSLGTSPDPCDLSELIDTGLAVTSVAPYALTYSLSGPMDLCPSDLFQFSLT